MSTYDGSADLKGIYTVKQWQEDLKGVFHVGQDSENLYAKFEAQATAALYAKFNTVATAQLKGIIIVIVNIFVARKRSHLLVAVPLRKTSLKSPIGLIEAFLVNCRLTSVNFLAT